MGILATATGLLLNSPAPLINPKVALSRSHPLLKATKRTGGKLVKVVLTADIEGLGKEGTIVEVKPAYAENFILAKRLGSKASQQMIDRVAEEAAVAVAAAAAAKKRAEKARELIAQKFGKSGIVIEVQVGDDGQPKEKVTGQDIANNLGRAGISVQAEDISIPDLAELGSAVAELQLHPSIATNVKVTLIKSKITFS